MYNLLIFIGKHITIQAPPQSGTQYYNYKKQFSIVLLGICDANNKFIYFNVGGFGSESDGGIFRNSAIGQALENGTVPLPFPCPIYGSECNIPYVFLGDAAFPLRPYLMTPFGGRNLSEDQTLHNQELSRGRCTIENSFGILSGRWQFLLKTMRVIPKNVDKIVLSIVLLHNFLLTNNRQQYAPNAYTDGEWLHQVQRENIVLVSQRSRLGARNSTAESNIIRNKIKQLLFNI